jgi:ABC-type phosphate transport system substrate-binding protein
MNRLPWLLLLAALAAPSASPGANDDLAVIVNKANPINNLTKAQLRKLVLAEQGSWPGGQKVTVVFRTAGVPERDGMLRTICRMSEEDYSQHIMHANFSGDTNTPPKVVASAAAVRQAVASTPGAIGFVKMSDVDDTVKLLTVDGAAAGAAEYKIKLGK